MLADFAYLRGLVLLRRIARALERLADQQERIANPIRRAPRLADLGEMDVDAINLAWRRAHPRYDGTDPNGPEDAA